MVNVKGESTVNSGKCTMERTSPWPHTITVNSGEDTRVSKLGVGEGIRGAGTGKTGGEEIQFTNLRSNSSYVSHSTAVKVW